MTFHVGQKVVCVDDDWSNSAFPPNLPRINTVYTLRESFSADDRTWWRLIEIVNPPSSVYEGRFFVEPAFAADRFRPIVERKTDISIFTKMLTPEGVDASLQRSQCRAL